MGMLRGVASLPLGVLYGLSDFIAFVLQYVIKYRLKVIRRNLGASFPNKTEKEIKEIEKRFYHYLGDQMIETLKTFNISDKELKRRVTVINSKAVNETLSSSRNAVLLMGHYCNWEWVQEIVGYFLPGTFMASIYHPLDNKMWDDIFIKLRSRWNAHIVPMKKAPRVLLDSHNSPWVCGFIADAWTRHTNNDVWIDFLNQKTRIITGPEEIGDKVGSDFFYLEMIRRKRGYYNITFHKLHPSDTSVSYPYLREFWKEFEKTIEKGPAYWLWSHKRWKGKYIEPSLKTES